MTALFVFSGPECIWRQIQLPVCAFIDNLKAVSTNIQLQNMHNDAHTFQHVSFMIDLVQSASVDAQEWGPSAESKSAG